MLEYFTNNINSNLPGYKSTYGKNSLSGRVR